MYRAGVPGRRIAELAGVPVSTVSYHLSLARATDPGLGPAHEEAATARPFRVTRRGLDRMEQLITMVQETGRYPSRNAAATAERSLAAWLQHRREDAWAGTLLRLSGRAWPCCPAGKTSPALRPTRNGGRNASSR